MSQDPFGVVFYFIVTLWLARMWWRDYREAQDSNKGTYDRGLPGATPCTLKPIFIAVAGTLLLLAAETYGEIRLGISAEQSDVSCFFLLALISAAIAEEFIFRGFLVIETRGEAAKWISVFVFSTIFALIHPYLWSFEWNDESTAGTLTKIVQACDLNITLKAVFTTVFIFVGSLWFYAVRFFRWNPRHSILVPIAAHLVKNIAVFLIKLAQGHVTSIF